MHLHQTRRLLPVLTAFVLLLGGCRHVPTSQAPPAVAADDNLNAVAWMQQSAEYRAATSSVFRAATARLEPALRDPGWDALLPGDRGGVALAGLPAAVIVDVDETMLDNSPSQVRQLLDGAEFDPQAWDVWVQRRNARAVPGAAEFAQAASALGITVFYVSNRTVAQGPATLANLRAAGFPVAREDVFLGAGTQVEGCSQQGSSDKTCRRRLVARGYRVLLLIGDQIGDFAQPADNSMPARAGLVQAHRAWWGERWWMLPNPSYGGWEAALSGNDRELSREARRQAKLRVLEATD